MAYDSKLMDTRTHLSTGEAVEAYVKRQLPTIEDRVAAYRKAAEAHGASEQQYESQYDEDYVRRLGKDRMLRGTVVTALIVAGTLLILTMLVGLSRQGFGWNIDSGLIILIILAVSPVIGWLFHRKDVENEVRSYKRWLSKRQTERSLNAHGQQRDIDLLRTGWVPGTIGGLAKLGLWPNMNDSSDTVTAPSRSSYQEYLRSPHWKKTREEALRRAGYRCQLDASHMKKLQVHHNNYDRLGNERPEDLIVLCDACHKRFHANGRMPGTSST